MQRVSLHIYHSTCLKLPVRPKFFLGYLFVGHQFSQEKVLKRNRCYRDRREKWWASWASIKNFSLKWWQNLLCVCYWAWNWDPLALMARWTELGQEKAETQNKHLLETRMVTGNRLSISSQWIQAWPYLFTAKHDVCMYNSQIIKYSKLLLSTDYGVSLCSAACTSFERESL